MLDNFASDVLSTSPLGSVKPFARVRLTLIVYIKFSVESLFPIDFCSAATAIPAAAAANDHSGAASGHR